MKIPKTEKEPLVFSEVVLRARILEGVQNLVMKNYIQHRQFDDVLRIMDAAVLQ